MVRYKKILLGLMTHLKTNRDIQQGVTDYIESTGRHWDLISSQERVPGDLYTEARTWELDGAIGSTRTPKDAQAAEKLPCPFVSIAAMMLGGQKVPFPIVQQDDQAVGRMAAEYLLDRGFQNLALALPLEAFRDHPRTRGFCEALDKKGLTPEITVQSLSAPIDDPSNPLCQMLRGIEKPAAVFGFNDATASFVRQTCRHMRISIPEQVAILGVDNDETLCLSSRPPLSSIEMPGRKIGTRAAKILDNLMRGRKPPVRPVLIAPLRVVTRQSTDILAIEDPVVAKCVQFIRERACTPIGLRDVSRKAGKHYQVLEDGFKKALGRTVFQEIRRVQIKRVNLLLQTTDMSLEKIAAETGFEDGIALSRAYRNFAKTTPGAYRREHRKHMLR